MPASYSQLQTYRRCPRQYEYAFVKKLKRPMSAGESFGASVHNALKKWGELEMAHRSHDDGIRDDQMKLFLSDEPTPSHAELTWETLQKLWHASFIVEGYENRVEADHRRTVGEVVMKNFYEWWKKNEHDVVAIETGFTCTLTDGKEVSGRIDRIERTPDGLHIIDFKTGNLRSQEQTDSDLQLSLYALAAQEKWKENVSMLTLLFISDEAITPVATARSDGQLRDARKSVLSIMERIDSGDMHPTPSKKICQWCPYRNVCDMAAA